MSRRVFELDAMATCEWKGHRMEWVRTRGHVGFEECRRCGATGPVTHGVTHCDDPDFEVHEPEPVEPVADVTQHVTQSDDVLRRATPAPMTPSSARDEEIRRRRRENPAISLRQLGDEYGLSKQRISAICLRPQ